MRYKKILVTSFDAGSSEYIAYYIQNIKKRINYKIVLFENSPAIKVFTKAGITDFMLVKSIQELLFIIKKIRPNEVLYGTGWQLHLPFHIKRVAKILKIKTFGVLDHWTGYRERFEYKNKHYINNLPDYLVVMDNKAKILAKKIFRNKSIVIKLKNYYIENIVNLYKQIDNSNNNNILFISEPTSIVSKRLFGVEDGFGYTEYEVLASLLENIQNNLIIRLHPADDEIKYNNILKKYSNHNIKLVKPYDIDLVTNLAQCNVVIGFDGMVLYISNMLNIKTIAFNPTCKRDVKIPIPNKFKVCDIESFKKLLKDKREN